MLSEMTRDQFIDRLRKELDECFPDEQGGFQVSRDDINDVTDVLLETCIDVLSYIGGANPDEL